ncbi:MAG: histidine phosphotransferase family protein [Maricaulis sp.]|jgi:histidine phosphotransferase ChpT|nr:histidine phosphotransferase family protein [Maricaulis sp.]MDG2043022.1 histidine phosphotransferase family protein [Maricaulis sp.]
MIDERPAEMAADQLAGLLCARLCHDLVSPVSALSAALSVLDDSSASDMHEDAMDLVRESARQSQAKLEFSRIAFGAAGSAPGILDTRELQRLVEGMFSASKPDIVWKVEAAGLEKSAARLLLNLSMLAVDSVPRGGTVTIEATESGGSSRLRLVSEGRRARLEEAVIRALDGLKPENGFDGRSIQPYYAGLIARSAGGRVSAHADEERIEIVALVETPAA